MNFENLHAEITSLNGASLAGVDRATYLLAICVFSEGDYDRAHNIFDRIVGWRSRILAIKDMGVEVRKTL